MQSTIPSSLSKTCHSRGVSAYACMHMRADVRVCASGRECVQCACLYMHVRHCDFVALSRLLGELNAADA